MSESPLFRLSVAAQREELKHERGPNGMIRGAAWIEIVRAVLIELREPTEEMVRAATPILGNGLASPAVKEFNAEGSIRVFQDMIDYLLLAAEDAL